MLMKIDFVTPFDSRKSLDSLYKIYDSLNIILQDDGKMFIEMMVIF